MTDKEIVIGILNKRQNEYVEILNSTKGLLEDENLPDGARTVVEDTHKLMKHKVYELNSLTTEISLALS